MDSQFLTFSSQGTFQGEYIPPGDKSISHRALLLGALATGDSQFKGFLPSEDCLCTLKALRDMGVEIDHNENTQELKVSGIGLRGLKSPTEFLDMGNSGTAMRLMMGVLAGQKISATLVGDESLSKRPMKRVTEPLKKMGAQIKGEDKGNYAPLEIRGSKLKGIRFKNKKKSAQVKSAILIAGLYAEGRTEVIEEVKSRDHTERFLNAMGAKFSESGESLLIEASENLRPLTMDIAGDISSAAFFIVGAAMTPGSDLTVKGVGLNPTRDGLIQVLKSMGADIEVKTDIETPEPIGTVRVRGGELRGARVSKEQIPSLIDELPILMIAMSVAEGESLITGAEELRVKESDRIACMVQNLHRVGVDADELPDGAIIRGGHPLKPATIDSFGDHRIAMSFAIASSLISGEIKIENTACISTSYPGFLDDFKRLFSPS